MSKIQVTIIAVLIVAFAAASYVAGTTKLTATGPVEFTVSVAAGDTTGVKLAVEGQHVRATTSSSDMRMYAFRAIRNSSGAIVGTERRPVSLSTPLTDGWPAGTQPDSVNNIYTLRAATTEPWNVYANLDADSLVFFDADTSGGTIRVQVTSDVRAGR